jgi:1-acyl-sn-glycerol-3-phosphate acyltransferase
MFLALPFGKEKISEHVYFICRYWGKILYFFMGIRHSEIFEAPHDFTRAHVFVGNHNSYMDIPTIVQLKHQPIRPLGKFESSKIPLFGLIYRHAVVMVDRGNPERRAESLRNLKAALEKHISIFIFPFPYLRIFLKLSPKTANKAPKTTKPTTPTRTTSGKHTALVICHAANHLARRFSLTI